MKVFISWSGPKSKAVADALHDWLPNVIQAVKPWMSESDIPKGAPWSSEMTRHLKEARVGLICLTRDNLEEPWILFEAGALSVRENIYVCTYLLDVNPIDIKGPLGQFQHTQAKKEDTRKLVHDINKVLDDEALSEGRLDEIFEVWWPKLQKHLEPIPSTLDRLESHRSERDILEEILELVRAQAREEKYITFEQLSRLTPSTYSTYPPEEGKLRRIYEIYLPEVPTAHDPYGKGYRKLRSVRPREDQPPRPPEEPSEEDEGRR